MTKISLAGYVLRHTSVNFVRSGQLERAEMDTNQSSNQPVPPSSDPTGATNYLITHQTERIGLGFVGFSTLLAFLSSAMAKDPGPLHLLLISVLALGALLACLVAAAHRRASVVACVALLLITLLFVAGTVLTWLSPELRPEFATAALKKLALVFDAVSCAILLRLPFGAYFAIRDRKAGRRPPEMTRAWPPGPLVWFLVSAVLALLLFVLIIVENPELLAESQPDATSPEVSAAPATPSVLRSAPGIQDARTTSQRLAALCVEGRTLRALKSSLVEYMARTAKFNTGRDVDPESLLNSVSISITDIRAVSDESPTVATCEATLSVQVSSELASLGLKGFVEENTFIAYELPDGTLIAEFPD